ncbi:ABC transporter permease [Benzoatithermus flavus]|uniref:ABC transmembrane type-1 domain-containing protein n=1 Tax=Benzoatithermus flavus TaxID=3108223 RepID=A0ABU8XVK5_9PROT
MRLAPPLTIALFLGPVAAGLAGTILPAFGWLPALDVRQLSLEPWRQLLAAPGVGRGVVLTLASGLGATVLALASAVLIVAASHERRGTRPLRLTLPFLLAVPHLASAIGTAFLVAPSGFAARLVSPWLTGWQRPPDLLTLNDPFGLALTFGLALRECPFLVLALIAAESQIASGGRLAVARTFGYGAAEAWLKLVLPQLYGQVRLPLYAVLAFALSVVDMAVVLGPTAPPVLAVQLLRWFNDPDLALRLVAAAGAVLQLGLILLAIGTWRAVETVLARLCRSWLLAGPSPSFERALRLLGRLAFTGVLGTSILGLGALLLWSVAGSWRFPAALPSQLQLASWAAVAQDLSWPAATTLLLAALSSLAALGLVLACLEHEARTGPKPRARVLALAYAPLLIPQVSFLFGLQVLFVRLGLDATFPGLLWSHLVFVLPYVLLMLHDPYLALDPRFLATGTVLGGAPARVFWRIKLPLLRRPILVAAAVGFSVSVAQYLPTVFVGGGRWPTLTTETLTLALGSDRRLAAAAALLLALLPLAALAAALAVRSPRLRHGR